MEESFKKFRTVIIDGIFTQGMVSLLGGPFLAGFLVALGASNFWIGVASGIPPLAQLFQLPAIWLVERIRKRRLICVVASFLSRIIWLLPIIASFFGSKEFFLPLILFTIFWQASLAAVSGASWNSWMRDLIPSKIMGKFFSRRMQLSTIMGTFVVVTGGFFIDNYERIVSISKLHAYIAVFSIGLILGLWGIFFLAKTPEPPMAPPLPESFIKKLIKPLKDNEYRKVIGFLGLWNFSINLANPFFVVYMLKRLDYSFGMVIIMTVISQVANILAFPIWGKLSDRFSNKMVLVVVAPLFLIVILLWPFTTLPQPHILTLPLLVIIHILGGFSTAGITLAGANIALKLAPQGQATSYLALSSVVNSLSMFIAPIIGGGIAQYFADRELSMTLYWKSPTTQFSIHTLYFRELDFLFFIAALVGYFSLHLLTLIKEEGEIEERIFIRELLGEMQRNLVNISSISGFRFMIAFPYHLLRHPVSTLKSVKEHTSTFIHTLKDKTHKVIHHR